MKKLTVEKPILFRPEMIRALCDNKKTVTRRLVEPQPPGFVDWLEYIGRLDDSEKKYFRGYMQPGEPTVHHTRAKFWPGLLLWAKESWRATHSLYIGPGYAVNFQYKAGGNMCLDTYSDIKTKRKDAEKYNHEYFASKAEWQSPLFMPRFLTRFLLKITDVKIERLHELDDIDAILEGTKNREDYARLWNEINGKSGYTWDKNPWVYRIQFERVPDVGNAG